MLAQSQTAVAEQIAMSNLFDTMGSNHSADENRAEAQLEARARKVASERHDLTYEQAYSMVLEQEPALYEQYMNEGGA